MRKTYMLMMLLLIIATLSLGQKLINESFFEMDLRQALNQLAYDTGETIIADDLVGGYVTMDLKDVTLERALDLLLLSGGFSWTKIDGVYYVSLATPDSDKFMYFSITKEYHSKNYKSSDLVSLLPQYMRKYVNIAAGDPYALTINAPKEMADKISSLINKIDKPKRELNVEITIVEVSESVFQKWEREWGYSSMTGTSNSFSITGDWFKLNVLSYLGNFTGNFNLNHTTENLKVLSESTIHMLDGAQSKLFSKTTRIYQYTEGNNTKYQSVEIGVETNILPMFMGEKVVLNILQTLYSAEESGASIPSSVKQGIQTSVIMDQNSRISVASIGFKTLASVESKIPLLGDIPLVGKLFTQLSYKNVRKRIVLFVALKGGDGK
ncbi:type II secretion system protein GspD [Mesoaciditoga sp.]